MAEKFEEPMFAFGIRIQKLPDGKVAYQTQSQNQGVPNEIVIMQMKAFLRNLENDYFNDFDKGVVKGGGKPPK